jgi:hypothetical protein
MKRIFVPSTGTSSWRALLADPEIHWKREASAMELAISWERAAVTDRGIPVEVGEALDSHPATHGAELLFAVPEHRVALPGGRRASQTDLWAMIKASGKLISMAVEGKAGEVFGPTLREWTENASSGKQMRLESLCQALGLTNPNNELRYQLFHRAASAVLEAERFGVDTAVLLIQNFRSTTTGWADFDSFVAQFGVRPSRGGVCQARARGKILLLFAWVDSPVAADADLEEVV